MIAFGNGEFVLNANVSEGVDVEFRGGDPAEAFAKRVVWIHNVPVTGRVGNGNRALGPVIVPLGDLNEG